MSSKAHTLDELDRKIIAVLAEDGRISNRKLAVQLGVTEGTIRGRIKRLEDENCIRLTAVTDISGGGWPRVALIGIHAAHSELESLCQKLAAMAEVGCVILCLGRFDILAIGLFKTLEHVAEVANNRILVLPGVRHVETSIAVKTIKYDYRAAKITPKKKPSK